MKPNAAFNVHHIMTSKILLAVLLAIMSLLMVWGSGADFRIDIAVITVVVVGFLLWAFHLNNR